VPVSVEVLSLVHPDKASAASSQPLSQRVQGKLGIRVSWGGTATLTQVAAHEFAILHQTAAL
jgi:hypothetical protein